MSKVTSIRLSDELVGQLDQLAAALDRSRAWLIEQAIERYVEEEAWQVAAISDALAAYRKGDAALYPHDAVMERLGAKIRAASDDADRHLHFGGRARNEHLHRDRALDPARLSRRDRPGSRGQEQQPSQLRGGSRKRRL